MRCLNVTEGYANLKLNPKPQPVCVLGALGEIVFPEKGCARKAAKDDKKNNRLSLRFSLVTEQGRTQT
jgi:hypothetical protein